MQMCKHSRPALVCCVTDVGARRVSRTNSNCRSAIPVVSLDSRTQSETALGAGNWIVSRRYSQWSGSGNSDS